MQKLFFTLGALLLLGTGYAQELKLSYFGETFTHYGVKGAYSTHVRSWEKVNRKDRAVVRSIIFSPGLAIYRHPQNHIGIIVMPELVYNRKNREGFFFETGVSPGLFRSFLEGKTYEVTNEGKLEQVPLAGRTAFIPSVFFGFGRDLSVSRPVPLSWFVRFHVLKQTPYNHSSLTRIALEAGISKPLTF